MPKKLTRGQMSSRRETKAYDKGTSRNAPSGGGTGGTKRITKARAATGSTTKKMIRKSKKMNQARGRKY